MPGMCTGGVSRETAVREGLPGEDGGECPATAERKKQAGGIFRKVRHDGG